MAPPCAHSSRFPLPDALREELAAYAAQVARDLGARPIPAENLHATVHFLGAVSDGTPTP